VFQLQTLDETFDLVLFLGVFYHLRYPLLGLDIAAAKTRHLFIMQSLTLLDERAPPETHGKRMQELSQLSTPGWPRMAFIEHEFAGDPSNWWIPNHNACEAMLRSAGLTVRARPEQGTYICKRCAESPAAPTAAAVAACRRGSGGGA
jgi:tRNA (mo5U34)-methyltransferase